MVFPKFVFKGETKDGLHVYVHTNDKYRLYYEAEGIYCPLCNQPIEPLEFEKMKKLQLPNYKASIRKYLQLIGSNQYDIFEELEELAEQIEKERNIWKNYITNINVLILIIKYI